MPARAVMGALLTGDGCWRWRELDGSLRSDEVILQEAHRGVPARLVVLLARNHQEVVAVLGVVPVQRGRQPIVDLLVRQLEAPSLFGVELDRNRLVAAMHEHVPAVRMALHPLVMRDVQHGRTVATRHQHATAGRTSDCRRPPACAVCARNPASCDPGAIHLEALVLGLFSGLRPGTRRAVVLTLLTRPSHSARDEVLRHPDRLSTPPDSPHQRLGEPASSHGTSTPPTTWVSSFKSLSVPSMATGFRVPTPP